MQDLELHADGIVFLFGHLFATEWVERKTDPVFGRVPVDARARVAPITGDALSEKSLGEAITYAALVQLISDECVEWHLHEEKGWNYDTYDRVYLMPRTPFPPTPLFATMERTIAQVKASPWVRARTRFAERGIAVDQLCSGLRRFRWLRADPYQFVCSTAERYVMDLGFYRMEKVHVAGPILAPVPQPDIEKMASYEFLARRLEKDIERLEMEEPVLAAALRDNVERSMLKTRSDEEYAKERYGDGNPLTDILQSAEEDDELTLQEKAPRKGD